MGEPMMHMGPMNPMMGMGFPMGAGRPPFMGPNGMEPFGGGNFQGPAFGGGFGGGFGAVGGMLRGRPDQTAPFAGAAAPRGPPPVPAEELAPVHRTAAIMCAHRPCVPLVHAFVFCHITCSDCHGWACGVRQTCLLA